MTSFSPLCDTPLACPPALIAPQNSQHEMILGGIHILSLPVPLPPSPSLFPFSLPSPLSLHCSPPISSPSLPALLSLPPPPFRITVPRIKRLKPLTMAEGRTVSDARPTQEEEDGPSSPKKQFNRHLRPKPPAGVSVRRSATSEYTHTYVHTYVHM